jgi:hypothetical protein
MRGNNNQIASLLRIFVVLAIGLTVLQEISNFNTNK